MSELAEDREDASRRGAKSADAFRTISEVAGALDVPQHVLRFWETKFTQIRPMKRGGGRRYYRPEDVDLLGCIRALLYHEGYTIRGVQRLLREGGVKALMDRVPPARLAPRAREAAEHGGTGGEPPHFGRAELERILDDLVQARDQLPVRMPRKT